ncbi:putative Peptidase M20 [Nitrospira sp. KM1]|uniref:M20/M25/M40 family metallo-hydrolase n=1 Tax=Nitrospira sp. KM1 TaxID=1936990 RepID=UPI0013A7817F|nr:M20/M25/M40 family metallo-hydrolase [Nitrospira sp. KM1]BCA55123.1 putative Peptidase M20 [Nitrospira sp. KM1]
MTVKRSDLEAYVKHSRPLFEDLLGQMVEIPSISMDPSRSTDIERMAILASQVLSDFKADVRSVETGGYPIVSGGWTSDATYPTVTVYNHMDVQPAQEPQWKQAPFAFKNEDGVYRGRGATDDKGPALAALLGARFALEQGVPINIRFLWELEEEIGSPHFAQGLKHRASIPRPDSVVVSDTIWIAKGRPAMPYGLRGLIGARLTLRTGSQDAHSGVTGGAARNPLAELMEIAQACVNAKTGEVKIPGFYRDVVKPTNDEIKSFLRSGFHVRRFKEAYGFHTLRTEDPAEVTRRIWAAPTFEIHGLTGGYHGPGVKTIVPGQGELKVSMRLVPNQTPEKAFALLKKFVGKLNPNVKVECEGTLHPFKGHFDGPYVDCITRAAKEGFGKEPSFIREGGSIGAVVTMQNAWKVPILFLGLSLPEHGYHAPNEYFDWGQASGGIKAFAHYFAEVAKLGGLRQSR